MLHKHEAQTRVDREGLEQVREGFQPSGGGTDTDDGEWGARLVLLAFSMPAVSWRAVFIAGLSFPQENYPHSRFSANVLERERTSHYFTPDSSECLRLQGEKYRKI